MSDTPAGKIDVVIRVRIDEAKVDEYMRDSYGTDEEIPGGDRFGLSLIRDLAEENSAGDRIDTIWLTTDNEYVESYVIAVIPGG